MIAGLSAAESAFVDALIEAGDPNEAAVIAGVQPSLGHDPRIQSALVDRIRAHGALDAVYARKVLLDLAKGADNDGVRYRAAITLWERGLGKVPDQVNIDVNIHSLPREALYSEIKQLITELGLPPVEAIEAAYTEIEAEEAERSEAPPAQTADAGVAQLVERPAERDPHGEEVAGSSPAAGSYEQSDPSCAHPYVPTLPSKWR